MLTEQHHTQIPFSKKSSRYDLLIYVFDNTLGKLSRLVIIERVIRREEQIVLPIERDLSIMNTFYLDAQFIGRDVKRLERFNRKVSIGVNPVLYAYRKRVSNHVCRRIPAIIRGRNVLDRELDDDGPVLMVRGDRENFGQKPIPGVCRQGHHFLIENRAGNAVAVDINGLPGPGNLGQDIGPFYPGRRFIHRKKLFFFAGDQTTGQAYTDQNKPYSLREGAGHFLISY